MQRNGGIVLLQVRSVIDIKGLARGPEHKFAQGFRVYQTFSQPASICKYYIPSIGIQGSTLVNSMKTFFQSRAVALLRPVLHLMRAHSAIAHARVRCYNQIHYESRGGR